MNADHFQILLHWMGASVWEVSHALVRKYNVPEGSIAHHGPREVQKRAFQGSRKSSKN